LGYGGVRCIDVTWSCVLCDSLKSEKPARGGLFLFLLSKFRIPSFTENSANNVGGEAVWNERRLLS
jgi:hypothetical protein